MIHSRFVRGALRWQIDESFEKEQSDKEDMQY